MAEKRRGGASAAELAVLRGELGERLARIETTLGEHTKADAANFQAVAATLQRVEETCAALVTDREVAKAVARQEAKAPAAKAAAWVAAIVAGAVVGAVKAAQAMGFIGG